MNLVKQCVFSTWYLASLPLRRQAAIMRSRLQTEPVRALFYHRVADKVPNAWTLSTRAFTQQIDWLRKRFDVVSLAEARHRIAHGRNHVPTACITFDDGYAENCQFALPLLLRLRLPFTYFVSTRHVLENRPFPHDIQAGHSLEPNSIAQIRQLAAAGVEIGGHTRNHISLGGPLTREELVDEIVGCKNDLEQIISRHVPYFAFPYGQPKDLSTEAFRIAYEAGFDGVCSAYGGYNFPGLDPFHIRRFHADPQFVRFKNWLTIDPRKLSQHEAFDAGDYRNSSTRSNGQRETIEPVVIGAD